MLLDVAYAAHRVFNKPDNVQHKLSANQTNTKTAFSQSQKQQQEQQSPGKLGKLLDKSSSMRYLPTSGLLS